MAARVVDDATGDPVAGARIENWYEAETPHAEPWEELREATYTTDRDGWALLRTVDRAPWYFVHAPSFGPSGEMALQDEYRITRGVDVVLEVRDWRDRPVPGAVVEALLGCGHTPGFLEATAGPDGRLRLPCIDPTYKTDLWVRTPGLAGRNATYWGGGPEVLPSEGGVLVLRGEPSAVVEGKVLRSDGTPAAGARVGTHQAHRGPWTAAGPDGRFLLIGAYPHEVLVAMAPIADPVPEGFRPLQTEFQSVPGVFATVALPAEEGRLAISAGRVDPEERRRRKREGWPEPRGSGSVLRLRIQDESEMRPTDRVRVVFVRDGDGLAYLKYPAFESGPVELTDELEPGTWTVTAGDPAGRLRPQSKRIELAGGTARVFFTLQPNPTWRPTVVEGSEDGRALGPEELRAGRFRITSDDGEQEAVKVVGGYGEFDGHIHVPASGPFALEFQAEDGRTGRVICDGPPAGAGPKLVLPPPETVESWNPDADRPRGLPAARLVVRLPDGRPAVEAACEALSSFPSSARLFGYRGPETRSLYLDAEGAATAAFDVGDRVTITPRSSGEENLLPFSTRIRGPGPWSFDWPRGAIVVRATDETGTVLPEFSVDLGGSMSTVHSDEGVVHLRGVSSDPLRLWVGAPGRRVHDLRLVLADGEKREVVVRMRGQGPVPPR